MSLLQEIIGEATSKDGDVARLLRHCLVLAARLPHPSLGKWAVQELEGYPAGAEVPAYRVLEGRTRGRFHVHGWTPGELDIPLGVLPETIREAWRRYEFRDSIAECQHLVNCNDKGSGSLRVPWPVELAVNFGAKALAAPGHCEAAWLEIPTSAMSAILDTAKTKVLSFALEIEAADLQAGTIPGVKGDLPKERLDQVFNNIFHGPVANLALGSTVGSQASAVVMGDTKALHETLTALGITSEDQSALDAALEADAKEKVDSKTVGTRVKHWLGEAAVKLATKSIESGAGTAAASATKAVLAYLGVPT